MTTTPISWTPAQAGYWPRDTRITTTRDDGQGCPVHFVDTRHGIVARTFVGDCMEIVLWRPANTHPTYQGHVELVTVDGVRGWVGFDPHGRRVTAVHPNYLWAEAPLLRLRTGRPSRADLPWDRAPMHVPA